MKKFTIALLMAIAVTITAFAQPPPQAFKYQAVARDMSGNAMASQDVLFRIGILQESISGTLVYSETHAATTNQFGLVSLEIGNGTVVSGVFAEIAWGADIYFLQIEMDENGSYQLMGTSQLLSVPYSLYAESSGDAGAKDIDELSDGRTGGNSVFLGSGAGAIDDLTDNSNVAVGGLALNLNTEGSSNTAVGNSALRGNTTGNENTAHGMWTLFYNNSGDQNTAAGAYVLFSNTEGNSNTAAGFGALSNNTTGNNNTADGAYALQYNTEGNNNVANGAYALNSNTTGSNNVALGYQAGFNEMGSDKLYIENSSSTTPLIYGDFAADSLVINGQLAIDGEARVGNLEGAGFRQVFANSQGKLIVNSIEELASQSNAPGTPILDYNCPQGASDTIYVTGFPESVSTENICVTINLTHTFVGDLEIFLIAPNGDILNLMKNNGGAYDNLVNTKFCDFLAEPLSSSQPPYTGTFLPIGSLAYGACGFTADVSSFSAIGGGNINPNGMWILKVFDEAGGDQGVLNNWSVELTSGGMLVDVGTNNYIPKWQNGTLTTNSSIYDNGNVGIGTTDPENSAALDVNSSSKGFLPPRMTYPQRYAIESPAEGLMIYNLETKTINYFDGTAWKNMNGTPDPWGIGSFYQGGRVAYIYQPGDPGYIEGQPIGIIAQTADISPSNYWGCYGTDIPGAWGTGLGTGFQNTNDIVAGCADVNAAARLCRTILTYANGYDDWYLPSLAELNKLSINKAVIGQFVEAGYWSSTENNSEKAWALSFYNNNNGYQFAVEKYTSFDMRVRAVRTFYHSNTVQKRLDRGQTPIAIFNSGIPLDSLYGKSFQGGLIAHLNTTTGAGFVAAPSNQSTGTVWGCDGTDIPGADGMAIGTGAQNTIDIEAGCPEAGIAADICANLILNSYSDWFLPSMEELNVLYWNLDQKGFGAFTNNLYWSSSEYAAGAARLQNFTDGGLGLAVKYEVGHVRAIRAF